MKTYYIFKINQEYYNLTKHVPYNLYMVLNGISRSSIKDVYSAYSLFNSINSLFTKKDINNIFKDISKDDGYQLYENVHTFNNYFTKECTKVYVHNSYLIIRSNKEYPIIFEYLKLVSNIFVCNFKNRSYFWLEDFDNNYLYNEEKKGIIMARE